MRLLFRTIAYAAGLFFLLGYGSYRLYKAPSQVEARLARSLSQFLSTKARLEGCEQPFLGSLSVRRIEVPAAPPIAERNLLELEDVKVDDPAARRVFRYRKASEAEASPPTVHAARGILRLDHEVSGPAGNAAARWNFTDLIQMEPALELLAGEHVQVLVDRIEIQLRDFRSPRNELVFRVPARDCELRHAEAGRVVAEADLAEGEYWSSGQIGASWTRDGGLHIHGGADDVRFPERWLPLLGDEHRELWSAFRPEGSFNLDLEDLQPALDGKVSLKATVRHYDTTARLGTTGLELKHLSGPMAVTASGVRFGKDAAGQTATAEILGMTVEAEGNLSASGGELRLRMAAAPLEAILSSSLVDDKGPISSLVSLLRPRGNLAGHLDLDFRRGEKDRVSGSLELRDVALAGVPIVAGLRGSLTFEQLPGEPGSPQGAGKLTVEEADLAGLGKARGEIRFPWTAAGLRVEFSDLKVDAGGPDEAGCIFASAAWDWGAGLTAVDLRWLGLRLATRLLSARSAGGSFQRAASAAQGSGSLDLQGVSVPAGLLWPECESLEFQGGKSKLHFEEGQAKRFVLESFKLSGAARSLRAAGTVALTGELDLVIFLDQGPTYAALDRLPDENRPADWKDAAKGSYRAFRITGSLAAPRVREIGALDPVFVRGR